MLRSATVIVLSLATTVSAQTGAGSRLRPLPTGKLDNFYEMTVHLSPSGNSEAGGGVALGCPTEVASHTDADFTGGSFVAQGGFVESEIAAATYLVDPAAFPIRIVMTEMIFATSNASVSTTTHWSILVWEGTPNNGALVAEFSSDDIILPHIVLPPGTNGVNVQVIIDPEDPEQIIVPNNGSNTFSIGYRIDQHNQPSGSPCISPPASCCNAFPTTDVGGLASPAGNWLNGINCGPFGCPANGGWATFAALPGLCTPSGDWVMRATWTPQTCDLSGACCLSTGGCADGAFEEDCTGLGGDFFLGEACVDVEPCPEPTVACCFGEACLDFTQTDCIMAGGVSQGLGSQCAGGQCPIGACCMPNGDCVEGMSSGACESQDGTYQGNGSDCSDPDCPLPEGACCFDTGFCVELSVDECESAGAQWKGPDTPCFQVECEPVGACCFDTGFCTQLTEEDCTNAGATFIAPGASCEAETCESDCPADVNGDGDVDVLDLIEMLSNWGEAGPSDVNGDGTTNVLDLVALTLAWGPC